jgi:malate synthase
MDVDERIVIGRLRVAGALKDFIEGEALVAAGVAPDRFWEGFETLVDDFMPLNREVLRERERFQSLLDAWSREHRGQSWDAEEHRLYLEQIGYLIPAPDTISVTTAGVDREVADLAGPQLVVPVTNARYALNAANARWGSLYDALYGTDVLASVATPGGYDAVHGARVIAEARRLLDEFFPLEGGSHKDAVRYRIDADRLRVDLSGARSIGLLRPTALRGWTGPPDAPRAIVLERNGLHWELVFDPSSPVALQDAAGLTDIVTESALTTIVDFEDSVATVDAEDKVHAYRNWLGLCQGDLVDTFEKAGRTVRRELADDRHYTAPGGSTLTLAGRSVLFVRNVGHLMTTDAVLDADGREIGEGLLDAVVTALCAVPGIRPGSRRPNSRSGSIYIVKPKMHGPAEVRLTVRLFAAVERLIGLAPLTLKLGLMDEERRTSVNLRACIAESADRLVFVNTGFLDRSGDEIHSSMEAGPMVRKPELRTQPWMEAYEARNVDAGLEAGLPGHGQIGKGMWTMPDLMADMLAQKIAHPLAGATTAWVPSPTAATLHALHYLRVDVRARQVELAARREGRLMDLLTPPIGDPSGWNAAALREELDNNVQSILGYVVRWIDQGIGCSKVPDIHDIALMEDRATLRISSQLLANWLRHGVLTGDQVRQSLERMAAVVDRQNADDSAYKPMCADLDRNIAFRAASELIFQGTEQPNGYTEPILHRRRREAKPRAGVTA